MKYSIDTSGIITPWLRIYPPRMFESLWTEHLPRLIAAGDLRAIQEVKLELQRKYDEILHWAMSQEGFFVAIDEAVQLRVRDIMRSHPRLVKIDGGGSSGAGPFVIALAQLHGAAVVCEEKEKSRQNPRIPDVCNDLGVRWMRLLNVIEEEGWSFR